MAFENGFNPEEHFIPIIECFEKRVSLTDDILRIVNSYIENKNLLLNQEELYSKIQKIMCNDYAYSCLRQYILYDKDKYEQISGKKHQEIDEINMQDKYKNFFKQLKLKIG